MKYSDKTKILNQLNEINLLLALKTPATFFSSLQTPRATLLAELPMPKYCCFLLFTINPKMIGLALFLDILDINDIITRHSDYQIS